MPSAATSSGRTPDFSTTRRMTSQALCQSSSISRSAWPGRDESTAPGTEAEQSSRPPAVKSAALVLVPPLSNPR